MIPAHGGRLINRIASGNQRDTLLAIAEKAPRLTLNARELSDLCRQPCEIVIREIQGLDRF